MRQRVSQLINNNPLHLRSDLRSHSIIHYNHGKSWHEDMVEETCKSHGKSCWGCWSILVLHARRPVWIHSHTSPVWCPPFPWQLSSGATLPDFDHLSFPFSGKCRSLNVKLIACNFRDLCFVVLIICVMKRWVGIGSKLRKVLMENVYHRSCQPSTNSLLSWPFSSPPLYTLQWTRPCDSRCCVPSAFSQ